MRFSQTHKRWGSRGEQIRTPSKRGTLPLLESPSPPPLLEVDTELRVNESASKRPKQKSIRQMILINNKLIEKDRQALHRTESLEAGLELTAQGSQAHLATKEIKKKFVSFKKVKLDLPQKELLEARGTKSSVFFKASLLKMNTSSTNSLLFRGETDAFPFSIASSAKNLSRRKPVNMDLLPIKLVKKPRLGH